MSCIKMSGHVVKEEAKVVTGAAVGVGNVLIDAASKATGIVSTVIGEAVTDATASAVAPPIAGIKRALLTSLQPVIVRALFVLPLTCGTAYVAKAGIVGLSSRSPRLVWVAFVVNKMVPAVVMGVGCGILIVVRQGLRPLATRK